ncbi:MAG TPA: PEP-CTERM sorting domain-containing protein [Gemmatimonadales bacterium]|jgi:hypothetical protein|nr:PEP-CTERM sorting domain-containing protein [Gemmatimonadales bacterium]
MMGRTRVRAIGLTAALCALAAGTARADGQQCVQRDTPNIIQPGNPLWAADLNVYPGGPTNNGTVDITATNPRSGLGSLELSTSGSLFDWAFFKRLANADAWGLLRDINCVTFDWYRSAYTLPANPPDALTAATWQEQTPVLRLLVRDVVNGQPVVSHLVWEEWYNSLGTIDPTVNDAWHFENLTGQNFWRHFDGGLTYTNAGCANGGFVSSADLQIFTLGDWVTNCYSSSAEIFGIMVGAGSAWPGPYHGFVDNVQLAFEHQNGFAVQDNFDFDASAVPEPASIALFATGLVGVAGAALVRRRRRRAG